MDVEGKKIALMIIDPQNDFCSKLGKLYVKGAEEDNLRLAEWILNRKEEIDSVVVTLDSHYSIDISHPNFWINKEGVSPDPFTIISKNDVINGDWRPKYHLFNEGVVLTYLENLESNGEFSHCIWPEHCIIGTWGNAVDTVITGCLREWELSGADARFVKYISKGSHPMTEHFGAFKAQVAISNAPETHINMQLIEHLDGYDEIYLAGQAKSHCVANTLKQIMDLSEPIAKKFILLEDTMSNVEGFENIADPIFQRAREMGIKFEAAKLIKN